MKEEKNNILVERALAILSRQPVPKGVTVALSVFPGAKVVQLREWKLIREIVAKDKPLHCAHCNKSYIPAWRRGGKIIQVIETDGATAWCCHYCGRRATHN